MGNTDTFKLGTYTVNGKVALANNDYKTCADVYGKAFIHWYTHYFSMGTINRK